MEPFTGALFFPAFIIVIFIFMILICCKVCVANKSGRSPSSPTSYSMNNTKRNALKKHSRHLYLIGYPRRSHYDKRNENDDINTRTYVSAPNEIDVPDNVVQDFVDEVSERNEHSDHHTHHYHSSADDNHNNGGHTGHNEGYSTATSWGGHDTSGGGHDSGWGGNSGHNDGHSTSWGGNDTSCGGNDSSWGGDGGNSGGGD